MKADKMNLPLPPCIIPDGTGTRISIHVVPRASKTEICGLQGDALKVRLQAPPVDGKANLALCSFFAKQLGLSRRGVTLGVGATSRRKTLLVPDLSPVDVAQKLGFLL